MAAPSVERTGIFAAPYANFVWDARMV